MNPRDFVPDNVQTVSTRTSEQEASNIVANNLAINIPHPTKLRMRIVGWVVHEDDVGSGTAIVALDKIAHTWRSLMAWKSSV